MSGDWRFVEFNAIRAFRGARAARVEVDGSWLWMSESDIQKNIADFGDHPELQKALAAYRKRESVRIGS